MTTLVLCLLIFSGFLSYSESAPKKIIHVSPELAAKIMGALQKCQPETGIDTEALILVYDGKYREDEQFKEFLYCSYKTTGFLQKGYLDVQKAVKAFPNEPLVEDGIRRCGSIRADTPKESLFQFFKCFMDSTPVKITL